MGAKGSKQHIASRFKAADFFFGQSSEIGQSARATTMAIVQNGEERLIAVGGEDGAIMVYGRDGVHVRLYEAPIGVADGEDDSSSSPSAAPLTSAVLFLAALPRSLLISVHATYIKLWSLEAMCEIFTLPMSEVPRATKASTPYQLTAAAMANEYDNRYCWLGTAQGEVLMFDCVRKRMSAYRVPLVPEVEQHCVESNTSGATPPTAITAIAQLPSDSSQLLIGYACDLVLTWHISTQKLHRCYKRSGCGGVSALCWESGQSDAARASEHFVVGHKNGLVTVWRRKYHHSPHAVFFLSSSSPGQRHPVTSVKWSQRTFGFFVSGGHPLTVQADPIETGGVVFVSGMKFEHRKLCTIGGEVLKIANPTDPPAAPAPSSSGVKEFVQILMAGSGAPSASGTSGPKAHSTPVFLCLDSIGVMRVHFPTVTPPVPPLTPTAVQETPFSSALILSDDADPERLRSILADLRMNVAPKHRPWLSLIRNSLSEQHLWPLNGGCDSCEMQRRENEEESLFRKLNSDGTIAAPDPVDSSPPLPALLVTTHPDDSTIRLSDATSPFQVDVLAQVSMGALLAENGGAQVSATYFCSARRELIVGTTAGEIILYRMQNKSKDAEPTKGENASENAAADTPQPAADSDSKQDATPEKAPTPTPEPVAAVPTGAAPAPSTSPAGATPAAAPAVAAGGASSSSSSSPPIVAPRSVDWSLDLLYRIPFSTRPVRVILYAPEVDKYAIADTHDAVTFLRPETGVTVKQVIPNAHITAVHFSTESLLKPKSGMPLSLHFLYVCGSDGSIHVFASDLEAKLSVIPSISQDETRLEVIQFMQTVRFSNASSEATNGGPTAPAASGACDSAYIICCTGQSIKLLTGGPKGVESLLSLRTSEPIRLAFLVCSPHLIDQRDDVGRVNSSAAGVAGSALDSPPPASPPAKELCLAIVDTKAQLTVYSVQLKILFSTSLRMSPSRVSPATFSMSGDGRVAFLPSPTFLVQAQLFPNKHYQFMQPPARLITPVERSIDDIEAHCHTAALASPAASTGGGWFAALLPSVAAHSTLFDTQMYEPKEDDIRPLPVAARVELEAEPEVQPARVAQKPTANRPTTNTPSRQPAPSSSSAQLNSARGSIATTKQTMAQNQALAANNLARAEELGDKSEQMANHANDFLAAARRLKEQQKSSWF